MTKEDNTVNFYILEGDELEFFRRLTKIEDEGELRRHIVSVQRKAFEVFGYNCIRRFAFLKWKISRLPGYQKAFDLLHTHSESILLDIGCCFGNDTRKAVADGWPINQIVASDLRQEFWEYGHELFNSTADTFPVKFIPGDVFDPKMLIPRGPFVDPQEVSQIMSSPLPPLAGVTTLTPLQGKLAAIHASAFFHLFSEVEQLKLAGLLASLLRPEKGCIIFGQHGAKPQTGFRQRTRGPSTDANVMFCHSPETWREMWVRDVFGGMDGRGKERISVDAELVLVERKDLVDATKSGEDAKFYVMNWCITRL